VFCLYFMAVKGFPFSYFWLLGGPTSHMGRIAGLMLGRGIGVGAFWLHFGTYVLVTFWYVVRDCPRAPTKHYPPTQ